VYSVPVEILSDCTHVWDGGAGIMRYKAIVILLQSGIIQVLVFNECVPYLHRFYSVLAVRAFSIGLSLYSLCLIFKKPYSMRICCASENVRHGCFTIVCTVYAPL